MKRRILALVAGLVLLAAACNTGPDQPPPGSTVPGTPPSTPIPNVTTPPAPEVVNGHELLLRNCDPMGYSDETGEVFCNRMGASGAFNTFAVNVDDPTQIRSLTEGKPFYGTQDTHRGVSDVSPDGRYMLIHAERDNHFPCFCPDNAHADLATPGQGAYTEVWLATTDGEQAWKLTDTNKEGTLGTFWARFNHDGTRVVYSAVKVPAYGIPNIWPGEFFGGEVLEIGTLVWNNGVPSLNDRSAIGNGKSFYEAYGWDPTGTKIVAASNFHAPNEPLKAQIYLFPEDGSPAERLTTSMGDGYQEFAYLRPDHTGYVVTTGYNGWILGTDRWLVLAADPNAEPTRVTHFADWRTGHPMSGTSGGFAYIDNDRAVAGFGGFGTGSMKLDAFLVDIP